MAIYGSAPGRLVRPKGHATLHATSCFHQSSPNTSSHRHRPPPDHPPQRGILEPCPRQHKEVEDVVRREPDVEFARGEVFGESSGAADVSGRFEAFPVCPFTVAQEWVVERTKGRG